MKKKVLYTLVLGVLFISVSLTGLAAADAPSSKSRSGLYNRTPVDQPVLPSAEASGLYSPLRANPTSSGVPRADDAIGTEVPVGSMPGAILLTAAMAYLGFVCLRKRSELRVKN